MNNTYTTPNGKVIELYNDGFAVKARFQQGGELPKELEGSWTSKVFAANTINMYLDKLSKRATKQAK